MLSLPVDVLVATPGRLLQLVDKGSLFLGDVRHVIVDEVDTMFEALEIDRDGPRSSEIVRDRPRSPEVAHDDVWGRRRTQSPPSPPSPRPSLVHSPLQAGFGDELDKLLAITTRNLAADPRAAAAAAAGRAAARVQHVAVGATHPAAAVALYERRLSGAKQMMVGGVHTVPAQLEQRCAAREGPDGTVAADPSRVLPSPPLPLRLVTRRGGLAQERHTRSRASSLSL